jgi:lysophospholipase L1-like esterase
MTQPDSKRLVTYAAGDVRYAQKGNTLPTSSIVLFGDSITAINGGPGPYVNSPWHDSRGYFAWANTILGQRLNLVQNGGKAGDRCDQIRARFATDAAPWIPGSWVHLLGGTNDVYQGRAAADIIADLTWLIQNILALGGRPIIGTVPPQSAGSILAPAKTVGNQVNAWIKNAPYTYPSLVVADYASVLIDRTSQWDSLAGHLYDNVHPNALGAMKMGTVLANALRPFVPASDLLVSSNLDPTNVLPNGQMIGSGTTIPTTGWYTSSGTATYSYPPRTDGITGSWFQVVVPPNSTFSIQQAITPGSTLAIGDSIFGAIEFQTSGLDAAPNASTQGPVYLQLNAYNGTAYTTKGIDMYNDSTSGYPNTPPPSLGILRTPTIVVPSGTTRVDLIINCRGGGTYQFGRATVRHA